MEEQTAKVVFLDQKTFEDGTIVRLHPDYNVSITRPGADPQWVGAPSDYGRAEGQRRNARALYRAVVRTWIFANGGK